MNFPKILVPIILIFNLHSKHQITKFYLQKYIKIIFNNYESIFDHQLTTLPHKTPKHLLPTCFTISYQLKRSKTTSLPPSPAPRKSLPGSARETSRNRLGTQVGVVIASAYRCTPVNLTRNYVGVIPRT